MRRETSSWLQSHQAQKLATLPGVAPIERLLAGAEVDGKQETIVRARTRPLRPVKCTAAD